MDNKENHSKKRQIVTELIKFNIVGAFNTLVTYGIYSFFVFIGVKDLFALCIEYPIGICISFFLNKKYTFGLKGKNLYMFVKMVIVYIPSLLCNFIFLWFFTTKIGLNSYISQFLALLIVTILTFTLQKRFVFRERKKI